MIHLMTRQEQRRQLKKQGGNFLYTWIVHCGAVHRYDGADKIRVYFNDRECLDYLAKREKVCICCWNIARPTPGVL